MILTLKVMSSVQLYGESFLVDGLKKPRSEISVYFQCSIHYLSR